MDIIDIEKHKLIVSKTKELLILLNGSDFDFVKLINEKSSRIINNYNNENLTIVDASKTELGIFNSNIKKMVYANYLNPYIKNIKPPVDYSEKFEEYACIEHYVPYTYDDGSIELYYNVSKFCLKCKNEYEKRLIPYENYIKQISKITNIFSNACDKTKFPKDLILKQILFRRKINNKYKLNSLEKALKETLQQQMLIHFENKNKKLILKYK